ncbi:MAG: hypothetical protein IJN76_01755 [Clostridia bacterium]|nr:hypothetical protein [Clostridia bacterium]
MEPEMMETIPATDVAAVDPSPTEPLPEVTPPVPEDITDRLAEEFLTLAEEFPQLSHPADLPDEVLDTAAREGIPLLDAYLRYRWQEEKKVAAATDSRLRAAQCSAGSLSRTAVETPPEQDAFLRAFRSAL